nr:DNA RNA helicase domain containing protein [Haemonchus contortus]
MFGRVSCHAHHILTTAGRVVIPWTIAALHGFVAMFLSRPNRLTRYEGVLISLTFSFLTVLVLVIVIPQGLAAELELIRKDQIDSDQYIMLIHTYRCNLKPELYPVTALAKFAFEFAVPLLLSVYFQLFITSRAKLKSSKAVSRNLIYVVIIHYCCNILPYIPEAKRNILFTALPEDADLQQLLPFLSPTLIWFPLSQLSAKLSRCNSDKIEEDLARSRILGRTTETERSRLVIGPAPVALCLMEFQEIIEIDPNQRTEDVRTQGTFESLMISPSTVANLKNHGYRVPSPVQMKAIPTGLTGLDMLVQAKSGTGKTLVFAILAIENLNLQSNDVQKIIIAPTREIATQIKDTIKTIAHFKTRIALLVGGTPVHLDVQALKRGAHIVVGTTGRICQMAQSGALNMKAIDLFVLDEADKLMEECFQKDINYLFSALPPSRQVAVFSATYPRNLDKLLAKFMRDASLVRLNSEDVQLIGIKQYIAVSDQPAINCLVHLLKSIQFNQCLVFCNLHQQCEPTCSCLEKEGFLAAFISAQMTQPERDSVIEKLKHNKLKVLVSTDLKLISTESEERLGLVAMEQQSLFSLIHVKWAALKQ